MNHVKSEHNIIGKTKIQLLYLLNPNFIALFALHVLCNIKTAMKSISTNPFLITGYQGPDYFCDRENSFFNVSIKEWQKYYINQSAPYGKDRTNKECILLYSKRK